ncbi:MAG: hypothetical protein R3A51_13630 [Nannocystaceae bacterium]
MPSLSSIAWAVVIAIGEPEAPSDASPSVASPLERVFDPEAPLAGHAPLDDAGAPDEPATSLPNTGVAPLHRSDELATPAPAAAPLEAGAARPTEDPRPSAWVAAPLRAAELPAEPPTDLKRLHMVRLDLLVGPVWRLSKTETLITTSVEVGRVHGFSGALHASVIVAPDRDFVAVVDIPVGVGVIARMRMGDSGLYGSVGLSAGILVHRAESQPTFSEFGLEEGPRTVFHRVDPDFRIPIRFAWSVGAAGFSLALIQGFNVRARSYERRGVTVWERSAYRIGLVLGVHSDIILGRARRLRSARRRRGKS